MDLAQDLALGPALAPASFASRADCLLAKMRGRAVGEAISSLHNKPFGYRVRCKQINNESNNTIFLLF